jgi:[acyl-carrier-protein] S-malonyltransferase/trans-AT polyketide synthase/acyltransferase/oxidoreductase domain-containing protein
MLPEVDIANHNAPGQVVISGALAAVEAAIATYRSSTAGAVAKVRMLAVSAPFHSRLMAPIEPGFRALLEAEDWQPKAAKRVACNTTGTMHTGARDDLIDALTVQISGTVRWVDCMHTLIEGADRIYEVGPGRPLRGFFRGLPALGQIPLHSVTNLTSARHALSD